MRATFSVHVSILGSTILIQYKDRQTKQRALKFPTFHAESAEPKAQTQAQSDAYCLACGRLK
jgi:hypothetical protein